MTGFHSDSAEGRRRTNQIRLGVAALALCAAVLGSAASAEAGAGGTATAAECGREGERACTRFDFAGFIGCQAGLTEVFYNPLTFNGTCIRYGEDGYPVFCGGENQRACLLAEKIPSCKSGLSEVPFPGGNCIRLDADGFSSFCGIDYVRPCAFPFEHILPCRAGLVPVDTEDGTGRVECRATCGQNGQGPCHFLVNPSPCVFGLAVLPDDFGVCGRSPEIWGETDSDEVPRGGGRTVFFIHGNGMDMNGGNLDTNTRALLERLRAGAPNVREIYGVDYNMAGGEARKLETYRLLDPLCPLPAHCKKTWGHAKFDNTTVSITVVAKGIADAIRHLPTQREITLVAYSFGGIMARQVVYRHYDQLRRAGKRIAEVITIGSPHRGGLAGALEINDNLLGQPLSGAYLQKFWACLPTQFFLKESDRGGCQLGSWIDWMARREEGTVAPFTPWFIDDRSYPQIRWVTVAANGFRLHVEEALKHLAAASLLGEPFAFLLRNLQDREIVPFHDSDATITVQSAFGIAADECFPFLRQPSPSGATTANVISVSRFYEVAVNHVAQIQEARSAVCYHADARVDPRVDEGVDAVPRLDSFPDELQGLSHEKMLAAERVQNFTIAALNLLGDTNGDGVVNGSDLRAHAGLNRTLECVGPLTEVALDASASVVAGATSYTWRGPFGTTSGPAVVVALPLGTHTITLEIESGGFRSTDQVLVTVADTTSPILGNVVAHTIEATAVNGTPFAFAPQASDVCGPVTVAVSPELTLYLLGSTEVTVTATDGSGNSAIGTVMITVIDTTPPAVTPPANVRAEANAVRSTVALGAVTATDIFPVTLANDAPPAFPLGATVTWTATDANGNAATAAHTITVVDTTPPALMVPEDIVATARGVLTPVDVGFGSATDIFGTTLSHDAPASFPVGTTTVTWSAVDGNGNQTRATQQIDVIYGFGGFTGPIAPGGIYKANRTLPLVFRLSFADGSPVSAAAARLHVAAVGAEGAESDPVDINADGGADSGDMFRFTGNHYQFNLSTVGWHAGSYRLTIMVDDGRSYPMDIVLR